MTYSEGTMYMYSWTFVGELGVLFPLFENRAEQKTKFVRGITRDEETLSSLNHKAGCFVK